MGATVMTLKTTRSFFMTLLICLLAFTAGCGGGSKTFKSLDDFNQPDVKIGVLQGSASAINAEKKFSKSQIQYFMSPSDGAVALETKKIDALAFDKETLELVLKSHKDLLLLDQPYDQTQVSIGFNKSTAPLNEQVNQALAHLKDNGSLKQLSQHWQTDAGAAENSTEALLKELQGLPILRVGTSGTVPPWTYISHGRPTGRDMELTALLCKEMHRQPKFVIMEYDALIAALAAKKIDIIVANLNITDERKKEIGFSLPYYTSNNNLLVLKDVWTGTSSHNTATKKLAYDNLESLNGKTLGVMTGTILDQIAAKQLPKCPIKYYASYSDCLTALKSGKIDFFIADTPVVKEIVRKNNDIGYIDKPLEEDAYGICISKNRPELQKIINDGLAKMKADGSLKKLEDIWFGNDESLKKLPNIKIEHPKGTIVAATSAESPPLTFVQNGQVTGYETSLLTKIFAEAGYELEVNSMDFAGCIPSLVSGKSDIAYAAISITDERKKSVLFSDSDYLGGILAAVQAKNTTANMGFWSDIQESFYRNLIVEDRYKLILQGLGTTIVISLGATVLGSLLGFGLCLLRRSPRKLFNLPAKIFTKLMQGTPIVVFLMITYYIIFGSWNINPIVIAILAFGVNLAAYVSEMMRSGIDAVDKGQVEAAEALGFTKLQAFLKIVAPQALRNILPVYTGEFISLFKMTSVVGYIAIQDLTKMSDIIRSRTYEAFFPLILTAAIYFVTSYIFTLLLTVVEYRIDPKKRVRKVKGVTTA